MADVATALSAVLEGSYTLPTAVDVGQPHRYIIFSDQHKGAGDDADEFRPCATTYAAALNWYLKENYTLILLGDVEELWEQGFRAVERAHRGILELEGSFPAGRYFRVWGNHDDEWMDDRQVRRLLSPYLPTNAVYEAIRVEVFDNGVHLGTLLLVHGHQGTFGSDKIRWLSCKALRIYRYFQRATGVGQTTPAKDACLRSEHDKKMYEWAAAQDNLILIAGHTHTPVWSSRTHLQKLEADLATLLGRPRSPETETAIAAKKIEVEDRLIKSPPCGETQKAVPCYFNTGSCRFADGDITGVEIENGVMRLVKWSSGDMSVARRVLEEDAVAGIFARLRKA